MNEDTANLVASAKEGVGYLAVQAVPILLEGIIYQNEEILELLRKIHSEQCSHLSDGSTQSRAPVGPIEALEERPDMIFEKPVDPTSVQCGCGLITLKPGQTVQQDGMLHRWANSYELVSACYPNDEYWPEDYKEVETGELKKDNGES